MPYQEQSFRGIATTLSFTLLITALLGCGSSGPERAIVTGKVTLDDVPVEKGSIAFIPEEGVKGPTAGAVIEKGEYKSTSENGPVLGAHRVEITAHRTGKSVNVPGAGGATSGPSAGGSVEQIEMYIPEKYNKKTELKFDVKSGVNTHDFKLTTK